MKKNIAFLFFVVLVLTLCGTAVSAQEGNNQWIINGSSGLGFPLSCFFKFNGSATNYGSVIDITSGLPNQAGSFWTGVPLPTNEFTAVVAVRVHGKSRTDRSADGFTFGLSAHKNALGADGEDLGFAGQRAGYSGLARSFASIFKYFAVRPNGERVERSYGGYFSNGERIPPIPEQSSDRFVDLSARGINLPSGNFLVIALQYRNGAMTTIIDDWVTLRWVQYSTRVNLRQIVGDFAYFGMTGSTAAEVSSIQVLGFAWAESGDPAIIGMGAKGPLKRAEAVGLKIPADASFKAVGRAEQDDEPIWLTGPWQ